MAEEKKEVGFDIFLGSLKEYEKLKKHRCEIVDTGTRMKDIMIEDHDSSWRPSSEETKAFILKNKVIGIIRYLYIPSEERIYGIPVRKKPTHHPKNQN